MTRQTESTDSQNKAPATAPGQALGYGLQYTRLTTMLLEAEEGSICSLEVLDDVAEQTKDRSVKLVQSKSALKSNPVADRAVSLWKTLSNWLALAQGDFVDPYKTRFELYVSRPLSDKFINAFHNSDTIEKARAAIKIAREELWGVAPGYSIRAELPVSLSRYVNPVLECDEEVILPIILNLKFRSGSGSPQADIESAIRRGPVSEAKVFDIADKLCGWVKRQADKQMEQGFPAFIARDDFHREYVAYVRSVDRDLILKSMARKPSDAEKHERLPDLFVQQLGLIELSYDDKLQAISEFLRASWDRANWSKTGDVHEDSFHELNDQLYRTWKNHRNATEIEASSKPDVERGKLLHSRCMLHGAKVQGMAPPSHFVPGCFHSLANEMTIGWHPYYRDLLQKEGAEK
jgi:hypothetical protein